MLKLKRIFITLLTLLVVISMFAVGCVDPKYDGDIDDNGNGTQNGGGGTDNGGDTTPTPTPKPGGSNELPFVPAK